VDLGGGPAFANDRVDVLSQIRQSGTLRVATTAITGLSATWPTMGCEPIDVDLATLLADDSA
jgi:hypothetical protein